MPVKHDSPEWQGAIQDIATLKGDVSAIRQQIGQQKEQQDNRHKDNQDRFKELEDKIHTVQLEVSDLKDVIVEAKGVLEGLKKAAQALAWTVGIVGGLVTIGIAIMTFLGPYIRTHLGLPNSHNQPPSAISQDSTQLPQDSVVRNDYHPEVTK